MDDSLPEPLPEDEPVRTNPYSPPPVQESKLATLRKPSRAGGDAKADPARPNRLLSVSRANPAFLAAARAAKARSGEIAATEAEAEGDDCDSNVDDGEGLDDIDLDNLDNNAVNDTPSPVPPSPTLTLAAGKEGDPSRTGTLRKTSSTSASTLSTPATRPSVQTPAVTPSRVLNLEGFASPQGTVACFDLTRSD